MEVDQVLRFICKLCNKRYPCGKSLGGHMRSHVIANSAESEKKIEANTKRKMFLNGGGTNFIKQSKVVEFEIGQSSYELRENPKKTMRAVDSTCKQCGKGFQSMKALCGHMACHSDRGLMDSHSDTDTETEDCRLRTRSVKSKRYENVVVKSSSLSLANGSSSVCEVEEQEQEDVALSLMMLSRDSGNVKSVVEFSDDNSFVLATKSSSIDMKICRKEDCRLEYVHNVDDRKSKAIALDDDIARIDDGSDSDSGYFLDECTKVDSDVSVDGFYRNSSFNDFKKLFMSIGARRANLYGFERFETELKKEFKKEHGMAWNSAKIESRKKKYECFNCKKAFNSYQALGGHRPCQKRSNARSESQYETGENSLNYNALDSRSVHKRGGLVSNRKPIAKNSSKNAEKNVKPEKTKVFVCPFCHKVYKNGQALGGHKRSHFIGGNNKQTQEIKPHLPNLLDLNLPAPEEN